jgi:CMP-N-acetylneuraminic acid synthetase
MNNTTLGVIPARAGSKRVDKKNIREVGGKPLLAHTIEQASNASALDHVIVSTEDEEIQDIAREYEGNVPFRRPRELAADDVTNNEVIEHALNWFESRDEAFEYVCLLPVTTPFRDETDINQAVQKLHDSSADSIIGVKSYEAPPFWAVECNEDQIEPYFDNNPWEKTRTQEFPTLYHPNGALFAARVAALENAGSFYTEETIAYEMPQERSLDIDEPFDLEVARALMEWRQ